MAVVDLVVDRREGDGDVLAGLGALDAHGRDELGGQDRLGAARADVVELGEEHGVVGGGLDVDGGRGRAGDLKVLVERCRLERGELAGEVEGDADTERGQLAEAAGAAEAGQGGDAGRAGAGRVVEALLAAGQGEGALVALQARVAVRGDAGQAGFAIAGAEADGAGDAEGWAGVDALVVLQVAVEPALHAVMEAAGLHVAAVVAARDPVDVDGGAVGADRLRGLVGLAEREQGVGLALHQQRRHLDVLADRGRRTLLQQLARLGVRRARLGDPLVHPAQHGLEPLTAAAGVDEDAGPQLLEHAVREQPVGEVPVRDRRGDGVHALVVARGEQGNGAAVGAAGHADAGVALLVELDLGLLGQPIDELRDVGDLALRVVQADLPGRLAEAAGRPGQDRVAVPGEILGLLPYVVLAAAEAVPEQDGGAAAARAGGEVRGVDAHPVPRVQDPVGAVDRGHLVGRDGRPRSRSREHDDGGPGGEEPPGPPKQPVQPGQSKIHASTVRG